MLVIQKYLFVMHMYFESPINHKDEEYGENKQEYASSTCLKLMCSYLYLST